MRSYLLSGFWPACLTCLAAGALQAQVIGQAEAIPGEPFGVGTVNINTSDSDAVTMLGSQAFALEEADNRVFYPTFSNTLLRGFVTDRAGSGTVTVRFLFTGDKPLRLKLYVPDEQAVEVVPRAQPPRFHGRSLQQWWRQYNAVARDIASANDHPPLLHTYLTSMLGNRLGLQPPLLSRIQENRQPTELQQTIELLAGTERIREGLLRQAMEPSTQQPPPADLTLPDDVPWNDLPLPPLPPDVPVEVMAMHVPSECFYIRFGSFTNYLWLSRLTREHGGDIGRMVTLRGFDPRVNERVQRQLAVEESTLAELFGDQVIADVAIIGRDLYLRDGAAIGLLFQAKNNFAVATDFNSKRAAALKANQDQGATLETVEIAGKQVSLLSTPDNHLRSYYATDGDFHLLTTSREIARRFLELAETGDSLGASPEFQHARTMMPLEREDTIFAYFSSAFFRALVSPQYQIELSRRLRAATDLQAVQLAQLAAESEGKPSDMIEQLVAGGLLPSGFGRRVDGSGPLIEADRIVDSARGERGSFLPITDVDLRGITGEESQWYSRRAAYYQQHWRQMDPLMVGIKRFALGEGNLERVVIDANISPLAEEKYGWIMSIIGPPTDVRIVTPGDELISVQATLSGGLLAPDVLPHHLFAGIRDAPPEAPLQPQGFLEVLQLLQQTPSYFGSWPKLGLLDLLPLDLGGGPPDAWGFSRLLLGVWRWQGDGFSVLSLRRDVLERTIPELRVEPTDNPAQIRARIGDVSQSQLAPWLNFASYERATQASVGNAKLLQALTQQLGVPPSDSLAAAERLLDAKLVCSLGGEYQLTDKPGDCAIWTSTHWPQLGQPLPEDYRAPLLVWFRGLQLDLTKYGDRVVMHAELDMQRQAAEAKQIKLPLFDLFNTRKE